MPRAYDLVGDVTDPSEIFPRLPALEAMAGLLAFAGYADAAAETRTYLAEATSFEELTERRLARLRAVWKAVEMTDSPATGAAERRATVDAAVDAYRERIGD